MPEPPNPKLKPHPWRAPHAPNASNAPEEAVEPRRLSPVPYAELHVTSNFTFLTGASHPEELVRTASELGYRAIAITDENSLAGIVRAYVASEQAGIPLVVGCHVRFEADAGTRAAGLRSLLVYPTDRAAYGRLCRLLTLGKRRAPKGECHLTLDDLGAHAEGLLAIVLPPGPAGEPSSIDDGFAALVHTLAGIFDDDRLSLIQIILNRKI